MPPNEASDAEQDALVKLRQKILEENLKVSEVDNDAYLLRWLVAREFKINAAYDMLQKNVEWKKANSIDTLLTWEAPEVLKEYYPGGITGFDEDGCPILLLPFGRADIRGLLESAGRADFFKYTYQFWERCLCYLNEAAAEMSRKGAQIVIIFDLLELALKQLTYPPTISVLLETVRQFEANYPEMLKAAYIINAPRIFTMVFSAVRPLLTMRTLKKVQIFNHDRSQWVKVLGSNIPLEALPKHWGGTMEGNDEYCSSKVCMGGKIPAKLYQDQQLISEFSPENEGNLLTATIAAGKSLTLEYEVLVPGSEMRWEVKVDSHDIGFSVHRDSFEFVPKNWISSNLGVVRSSLTCDTPGKYMVKLDNTHSRFRSKTIKYFVQVTNDSERLFNDESL